MVAQLRAKAMQDLIIADITSRHRPVRVLAHDDPRCASCNVPWPCRVALMMDEIRGPDAEPAEPG